MVVAVGVSISMSGWLGFDTISRVIGVVSNNVFVDWYVTGPGLVLGNIGDLLLISVGGLVGDNGDFSFLLSDDSSVLGLIDSVESSVLLSSVLGLMLDSVVGVEDSVVPGLLISSVLHLI